MRTIQTNGAPKAIGPYSQGVIHNGVLYISGQIPFDPVTNEVIPGGIKEQTKRSLENLKAIIEEAGSTINDVIRCGVFVKDMDQFGDINEVYAEFFKGHKPARSTVEVSILPKNVMIEIDAIVAVK